MGTLEGTQTPSETDPLTLARFRGAASAPGKCILLGEHAVVYGEPCLSVAIDRRTTVVARAVGDAFTVNGYPLDRRYHAYFESSVQHLWRNGPAVRFETRSDVPSTSGLGSSAALTAAAVGSLHRLRDDWDLPALAEDAFLSERLAQGSGSPNDTSVAVAGGAVLLAPEKRTDAGLEHLWTITLPESLLKPAKGNAKPPVAPTWEVHRMVVPELSLVIGITGVRGKTSEQVAKVRRFVDRSGFGRDLVKDIGKLVWQALDALREEDHETLGRLMDRCQGSLHTMGVNHPSLQRFIDACRAAPGTLGAKLTGAGGGGSMICLTTDPAAAIAAIERTGGQAVEVVATNDGLRPELDLELSEVLPAGFDANEGPGQEADA